jgi:uncharacterized membrane protein
MNKLFDLRFVIGLFFLVIGILVLLYSFITESGKEINRLCGILFIVFAALMLFLSGRKKEKTGS